MEGGGGVKNKLIGRASRRDDNEVISGKHHRLVEYRDRVEKINLHEC